MERKIIVVVAVMIMKTKHSSKRAAMIRFDHFCIVILIHASTKDQRWIQSFEQQQSEGMIAF
jgi:hypothetical protein